MAYYQYETVYLDQNRLSIIDPAGVAQKITNEESKIWLTPCKGNLRLNQLKQ